MRNRLNADWIENDIDVAENPNRRLVWLFCAMAVSLVAVVGRVAWLQLVVQDQYLSAIHQSTESIEAIATRDGRILLADGAVLAHDVPQFRLQVHYRWLEEPPNAVWVKKQALARLSRIERRDSKRVAAETELVLLRREELWQRLSQLLDCPEDQLARRRRTIQNEVERIVSHVEQARLAKRATNDRTTQIESWLTSWVALVRRELTTPPRRQQLDPIEIAEEFDYHTIVDAIDADLAAEIETHPERYPGTEVVVAVRREYPQQTVAAHIAGVRTPLKDEEIASGKWPAETGLVVGDRVGRSGLELSYDSLLRGRKGKRIVVRNRQREILSSKVIAEPVLGKDIVLNINSSLQRAAEQLLDEALTTISETGQADDQSNTLIAERPTLPQGGVLVAIDIHSGAVLAAACAPRFDPNLLIVPDAARWREAADDPRRPFFPRLTHMALPPGSVFKPASAVALVESGAINPLRPFDCRGYLDHPDHNRCLIFRHFGVGHGPTKLEDALCRSCNTYFFAGARLAGLEAIVDWSKQLGFGSPTGIDLPHESAGHLPSATQSTQIDRREGLAMAIGQSSLKVTPLQVARMMAAIANRGNLVTPRIVAGTGPSMSFGLFSEYEDSLFSAAEPRRIESIHPETLSIVARGLEMVVQNPGGTAYKTGRIPETKYAGKTGTAEVGPGKPDHAWFAGYFPAQSPRIAFAVVLENGGSGGKAAVPIARKFLTKYLETIDGATPKQVAEQSAER